MYNYVGANNLYQQNTGLDYISCLFVFSSPSTVFWLHSWTVYLTLEEPFFSVEEYFWQWGLSAAVSYWIKSSSRQDICHYKLYVTLEHSCVVTVTANSASQIYLTSTGIQDSGYYSVWQTMPSLMYIDVLNVAK